MTSAAKVSVVIPCHNREESVERAVRSVLGQTISEIEVIAVDDASEDATLTALHWIDDPRLTILPLKQRSGAAAARNHGAKHATAPWLAFQDSDDFWHPEKLEAQLETAENSSAIANFCRMDVYQGNRLISHVPAAEMNLSGDLSKAILRDSFISTQTVLIRTEKFHAIGGMDPDLRALDDWDMMIKLAQLGPIDFVDRVLVDQHMSENSMTHDRVKQLEAQIRILRTHDALLSRYPRIKAVHLNRIAGAYRQMRAYKPAAAHAGKALRLMPGNPRFWGQSLLCSGAFAAAPILRLARR